MPFFRRRRSVEKAPPAASPGDALCSPAMNTRSKKKAPSTPMDSPFVHFIGFRPPSPIGNAFEGFDDDSENANGQLAAAAAASAASAYKPGPAAVRARRQAAADGKPNLSLEEMAAAAVDRKGELQRTQAIAAKVKKPTPPSNVFLPPSTPVAAPTPQKECAAPDWEALPAGTKLRVWWEGNQAAFECTIRGWHVAIGENGNLFYTHRCEYEGGTFDHDLAKVDFEVVEVASVDVTDASPSGAMKPLAEEGDAGYDANYEPLSPRRRWLGKQDQELQQFAEELEQVRVRRARPLFVAAPHRQSCLFTCPPVLLLLMHPCPSLNANLAQADIGTPIDGNQRARMSLRCMKQPLAATPRTPRAADGSVMIIDPSDAEVTYRNLNFTPMNPVAAARTAPHQVLGAVLPRPPASNGA
jgi:hypothetical protein